MSKKPAAKSKVVGKPAQHAKPTAAQHAARVAAAKKAAASRKHNLKTGKTKKSKKHTVKRTLALAEGVGCCAAEAVAASLRLSGRLVTDADVLALYRLTADDPDEGAFIAATLDAAAEHGLVDIRPQAFAPVSLADLPEYIRDLPPGLILGIGRHTVTADASGGVWSWGDLYRLGDAEIDEAWEITWP
jgi:hypothetical protein